MLFQTILYASAKLFQSPACLGHTNDRDIEVATLDHCLEGGKDFLVSQIAGLAEEDECICMSTCHKSPLTTETTCLPPSPNVLQNRSAWQTEACSRSPLHHGN